MLQTWYWCCCSVIMVSDPARGNRWDTHLRGSFKYELSKAHASRDHFFCFFWSFLSSDFHNLCTIVHPKRRTSFRLKSLLEADFLFAFCRRGFLAIFSKNIYKIMPLLLDLGHPAGQLPLFIANSITACTNSSTQPMHINLEN